MSAEDSHTTYPADIELFRYMLENAEIETSEIEGNEIILDSGILIKFDDDGMLVNIEASDG